MSKLNKIAWAGVIIRTDDGTTYAAETVCPDGFIELIPDDDVATTTLGEFPADPPTVRLRVELNGVAGRVERRSANEPPPATPEPPREIETTP